MIHYTRNLKSITSEMLQIFFVGWPNPPSPAAHLNLLRNSDEIILAIHDDSGQLVGFITAISDKFSLPISPCWRYSPAFMALG